MQQLEVVPSSETRPELMSWLATLMPSTAPNGAAVPPLRKVEQCGTGIPYVLALPQMLPVTYAPLLSATRVKVPARLEFDAVANWKLVRDALHRNGIPKPLVLIDDTEKLIKGNFQANLQMLQWFKGLHTALQESGIVPGQGRPPAGVDDGDNLESSVKSGHRLTPARAPRRSSSAGPTTRTSAAAAAAAGPPRRSHTPTAAARPSSALAGGTAGSRRTAGTPVRATSPNPARPVSRMQSAAKPGASAPRAAPSSRPATASMAGAAAASAAAAADADVVLERQFYYDKLRTIETLVNMAAEGDGGSGAALARSIREVLYATS